MGGRCVGLLVLLFFSLLLSHCVKACPLLPSTRANGGCAVAPAGIHIYYPLVVCVVFVSHGEWWFVVFCDCG